MVSPAIVVVVMLVVIVVVVVIIVYILMISSPFTGRPRGQMPAEKPPDILADLPLLEWPGDGITTPPSSTRPEGTGTPEDHEGEIFPSTSENIFFIENRGENSPENIPGTPKNAEEPQFRVQTLAIVAAIVLFVSAICTKLAIPTSKMLLKYLSATEPGDAIAKKTFVKCSDTTPAEQQDVALEMQPILEGTFYSNEENVLSCVVTVEIH